MESRYPSVAIQRHDAKRLLRLQTLPSSYLISIGKPNETVFGGSHGASLGYLYKTPARTVGLQPASRYPDYHVESLPTFVDWISGLGGPVELRLG
jgi:hypothetical protein